MIKLIADKKRKQAKGKVFYNSNENGMDTTPETNSDITLVVAYVQIGFNVENMCANQIFGLAPISSWINRKMFAPSSAIKCALKLDEDFDYGTWRIDKGNEWKYYFDSDTDWFVLGIQTFQQRQ